MSEWAIGNPHELHFCTFLWEFLLFFGWNRWHLHQKSNGFGSWHAIEIKALNFYWWTWWIPHLSLQSTPILRLVPCVEDHFLYYRPICRNQLWFNDLPRSFNFFLHEIPKKNRWFHMIYLKISQFIPVKSAESRLAGGVWKPAADHEGAPKPSRGAGDHHHQGRELMKCGHLGLFTHFLAFL